MSNSDQQAASILTVDLGAIVENWKQLSTMAGIPSAAVVKADAYGLGAGPVSAALEAAGCRDFFVAHLEEGVRLRESLGPQSRIGVLNGTPQGSEGQFLDAALTPVINTLGELSAWRSQAKALGRALPVILQVDSGMSRLGLAPIDVEAIAADTKLLDGLEVQLVMSHLACADSADHPANQAQKEAFESLRAMLPAAPASLANSSGVFLGGAFHFDLLRPGAALYGINPTDGAANPMRQVATLSARVIQLRAVGPGTGIGYGHVKVADRPTSLATVSLGYADGWPRSAATHAFFRGQRLPFAGRVSMDSIILDTSAITDRPREGDLVDLICPQQTVDDVARAAGTIGYEILTRLGPRSKRRYIGAA